MNASKFLAKLDPKKDLLLIETANGLQRSAPLASSVNPFAYKRPAMTFPAAGATLSNVGTTSVASGGTITHVGSATQGFFANFPTLALVTNAGGIHHTDVSFRRGTSRRFNGFSFRSRALFPDAGYNESGASTGSRIALGLSADTLANTLASDDAAVERIIFERFSVNGGAINTNWQISTKGSGAETLTNTGVLFEVGKVYDFGLDVAPAGGSVDWFIYNATDDILASGSISATLPQATTALRGLLGVFTIDAVARNIRMANLVIEAPL